jgi:hypothetical protein
MLMSRLLMRSVDISELKQWARQRLSKGDAV